MTSFVRFWLYFVIFKGNIFPWPEIYFSRSISWIEKKNWDVLFPFLSEIVWMFTNSFCPLDFPCYIVCVFIIFSLLLNGLPRLYLLEIVMYVYSFSLPACFCLQHFMYIMIFASLLNGLPRLYFEFVLSSVDVVSILFLPLLKLTCLLCPI